MPRKDDQAELREFIEPYVSQWLDGGMSRDQAFRDWAVSQVLWDYDLSTDQVREITSVDAARDRGIDGWYYASEDDPPTLHVIQAKDTRAKVDDVLKMRNGFKSLFDARAVYANVDAKGRASDLAASFVEGTEVEFHLVTSTVARGALRDDVAEQIDPISLFERELPTRSTLHDLDDLARELRVVRNDPIDAEFTIPRSNLFEMHTAGNYPTVAAAIPGLELARLFREHRTNLFRLNPRYYLSARGSVNKGMLRTLRSPERTDFYLYNNGLTAVCGGVDISTTGDVATVRLRDLQIVNGCQTTATLHEAWEKGRGDAELGGVQVLVRFIEAPPAIAPLIMERTNTQNPMKAEDERANDRRQYTLKEGFDLLSPPYFYEHKRGIWPAECPTKREKQRYAREGGGYRHITIKDLAQACLAFLGDPGGSIEGPRFVFRSDERYERVFPPRAQAVQLLLPYVLHEHASAYVAEHGGDTSGVTYLRYPLVAGVSHVLHEWLGLNESRYLQAKVASDLVATVSEWVPEVMDFVFPELLREAKASANGIRSVVRTKDWLEEPLARAVEAIRRELDRDASHARRTETPIESVGLRSKIPLPIKE